MTTLETIHADLMRSKYAGMLDPAYRCGSFRVRITDVAYMSVGTFGTSHLDASFETYYHHDTLGVDRDSESWFSTSAECMAEIDSYIGIEATKNIYSKLLDSHIGDRLSHLYSSSRFFDIIHDIDRNGACFHIGLDDGDCVDVYYIHGAPGHAFFEMGLRSDEDESTIVRVETADECIREFENYLPTQMHQEQPRV